MVHYSSSVYLSSITSLAHSLKTSLRDATKSINKSPLSDKYNRNVLSGKYNRNSYIQESQTNLICYVHVISLSAPFFLLSPLFIYLTKQPGRSTQILFFLTICLTGRAFG